jgi:hypothetical protein
MGKTSEPQAGQGNTPSGSLRISGCPHSQEWSPRASGSPTTSCKVSSRDPSNGNPQEPQRAKLGVKETSLPDSQNGQMTQCDLDAVLGRAFIAVPFVARVRCQ